MQSNFGSSTNPTPTRDHFTQGPLVSPTTSTIPPISPSFIPPPPPMPDQFLTIQSNSWSTLQLPKSTNKLRPRLDIDLCKFRQSFQHHFLPAENTTSHSRSYQEMKVEKPCLFCVSLSATAQVDELHRELAERVTDRVGLINEQSSPNDVQRWLASKHVSAQ